MKGQTQRDNAAVCAEGVCATAALNSTDSRLNNARRSAMQLTVLRRVTAISSSQEKGIQLLCPARSPKPTAARPSKLPACYFGASGFASVAGFVPLFFVVDFESFPFGAFGPPTSLYVVGGIKP